MILIKSLEEYLSTARDVRAGGYRISNCFLLPDEVERIIRERSLYRRDIPGGILLLDDHGKFCRCYYFLSPDMAAEKLNFDKDTVIELPFRVCDREIHSAQEKQILRMGFILARESARMEASAGAIRGFLSPPERFAPEPAGEKDVCAVLDLFESCFDPLFAFLPTEEELRQAVLSRRVRVLRQEGEVCAALNSKMEGRHAVIAQLAVSPDYRGEGRAKVLVQDYHLQYIDKVKGFRHWTDIHNDPALHVYRQLGYTYGIRRASEYIQRGDKK